jgi:membrane fusion protein (multidrug efflux system)
LSFYAYHKYSERYPSTDNAYVTANVIHVAPQLSGQVKQLSVLNQQYVQRGDLLYQIDPKSYQFALASAQAKAQQARQEAALQVAEVQSAEAEVHRQEVLLSNASKRAKRNDELKHNNYVSKQVAEDAEADELAIAAALKVAKAKLNEAREKLGQPGDDNEKVKQANADLHLAQLNLEHTQLTAGCDGRIAQLSLQPGDTVQAGQSNFVLICDHQFWIDANFKETELARIRPGQPVSIKVDMYPGVKFSGSVESINGASGVAFSLLPPQNASGNWVKITQRVPVRIRVKTEGKTEDAQHPLLVGTSADVSVDTSQSE